MARWHIDTFAQYINWLFKKYVSIFLIDKSMMDRPMMCFKKISNIMACLMKKQTPHINQPVIHIVPDHSLYLSNAANL